MSLEGRVGGIEWHRIIESEEPDFEIFFLLPDATEETLAPHRDWLEPRFLDPASNKVVMAMQSYVLKTRHRTILVDSCVGNDKERRFHPPGRGAPRAGISTTSPPSASRPKTSIS